MLQLIRLQGKTGHINVPQEISTHWQMVGISLLNDEHGAIMPVIAEKYNNNAERINMEVLTQWVQGKGIADTTWQGLLGVLKEHCPALSQSIKEALLVDEEKPQQSKHLDPPAAHNLAATPPSEEPAATSTQQHELSSPRKEQQPKPSTPPPTDSPKQTPPPPTCPSFNPQSAKYHFAEYLKRIYNRPINTADTWPPSPSECYINLAIITRERIKTEERRKLLHKLMLHGDVDEILETKVPVKLEALLDPEPGKNLECVLVEGAPGVGKSTLSRQICKNWAEGKLFQQYSLVLLLHLRDATVQAAETVANIIHYMAEDWVEDISRYLEDTHGKHTLIILEGLDELPRHLISQESDSIFTRLLAGNKLYTATIMITSRPSATTQLWKKWKARITRNIEVLGFSEDNITEFIASILGKEEITAFNNYLCATPSIRQMMYIPLHSGIIIEIYRTCKRSHKYLPTNKTALYKVLVQTILTRYLASHPTYKDDEIDVKQFTNLPSDVQSAFDELIKLAYKGVTNQQLIFRDRESEIPHLGFMHVVTELYALERKAKYSCNFLHLSIQEFLGAYYVSLMDISKQESLLESMCSLTHLCNMALFLAGLTKFTKLNRSIVKRAIHSTCKEKNRELILSDYALKILYEIEDASLLEGYDYYCYNLTNFSPSFIFTAVGYCVSQSNFTWRLQLGSCTRTKGDTSQYMQSAATEKVQLLARALTTKQTPSYFIDELQFYHVQPDADGCLPALLPAMKQLRILKLRYAPLDVTIRTLQAVAAAPITTLEEIHLGWSQFDSKAVTALCTVLGKCCQYISQVWLYSCRIDDKGASYLSCALRERQFAKLTILDLRKNNISETGALEIAEAVQSATALLKVKELLLYHNSSISSVGNEKLHKFKKENEAKWLMI